MNPMFYGFVAQVIRAAPPVSNAAPDLTGAPVISGVAIVGEVLTVSTGSWLNNPTSFSYIWRRDGTPIVGAADANTYTIAQADIASTITVSVIATNDAGSTSATGAGVGPVTGPTPSAATLPGSPLAIYAMTAMNGWGGALIRVRRAFDNAESDVGFDPSTRKFDTLAATAFANGSQLYVTKWYDQSGNGRDATQATQAAQPLLYLNKTHNGVVPINVFSRVSANGNIDRYLTLPSSVAMNRRSATHISAIAPQSSLKNMFFFEYGSSEFIPPYNDENEPAGMRTYDFTNARTSAYRPRAGQVNVIGARYSASSATIHVDTNSSVLAPLAAGTTTGGRIGNTAAWASAGVAARCEYLALACYATALSDSDYEEARATLSSEYGVASSTNHILAWEGDSTTEGNEVVTCYSVATLTAPLVTFPVQNYNLAIGGQQVSTLVGLSSRTAAVYNAAKTKNIYVLVEGINDLRNGQSGAAVWNNLRTMFSRKRAEGWKTVGVTITGYQNFFGTNINQTEWNALNGFIRAGAGLDFDVLADVQANPTIGPVGACANTTYYLDGLHLTEAGDAIRAQIIAAAVNQAINL